MDFSGENNNNPMVDNLIKIEVGIDRMVRRKFGVATVPKKTWNGPDYLSMLDELLLLSVEEETQEVVTAQVVEEPESEPVLEEIVQEPAVAPVQQPMVLNGTLGMDDELKEKIAGLKDGLTKLDNMDESIDSMKQTIDERLNVDFDAMYDNVIDQMNVESVKEYRNIQAVIVEENAKQNHVLVGIDEKTNKLKGRMNHVMIMSIISFVVSILVMIVTILPAFGIEIF